MKILAIVIAACLIPAAHGSASSPRNLPKQLQGVGIDQHLNAEIPLDASFTDQDGNPVQLKKYFGSKPVIFAPVYFTCPMLCNQIMSGLVAGLRPLSLKPGRDFEIVAMSFYPADKTADAKRKRDQYSHNYSSRGGTKGWNFLTGPQASIDQVTKAIGFHYHWDAAHKMFVHASGIMILTPEGRVARYFYGVEYEPKDLKLGLVEASHDRIGSAVDQILLFCYHYDPTTGKYGAVVINLLRIVAAIVLIALTLMLVFFWRRDLRAGPSILKQQSPMSTMLQFCSGCGIHGGRRGRFLLILMVAFCVARWHGWNRCLSLYQVLRYHRRSENELPPAALRTTFRPRPSGSVFPSFCSWACLPGERSSTSISSARRTTPIDVYVDRQAVDVEDAASERPARNQRTARACRAADSD